MGKYVTRRLLLMIPTALLATMVVFGLMKLVPGDAAIAILADLDVGTQEEADVAADRLRERFGLNESLPVQYWVDRLCWKARVWRLNYPRAPRSRHHS